ncbi:MAG: response regulator transcription factor [Burkholderiales bacterium]
MQTVVSKEGTHSRSKSRILIVDDNPVIRELLRGIMRHDDRLVIVGEAVNGDSAIDLVEKLRPDLICLDVQLPGIDGIAVLRAIRAMKPEARVVLVTGHATSSVVSEALTLGASGFVVKPFNAARLLATVHSALAAPPPVVPATAESPPQPVPPSGPATAEGVSQVTPTSAPTPATGAS